MSNERHHGAHPDGHKHEMTPEWKAEVRAAMEERGVHDQWLADRITERRRLAKPMKRWTISKLLRHQQTSTLVPDICAILGLPPPMTATPHVPDEETRKTIDLLVKAPPEVRRAILLLLEDRAKNT